MTFFTEPAEPATDRVSFPRRNFIARALAESGALFAAPGIDSAETKQHASTPDLTLVRMALRSIAPVTRSW